MRRRIFEDALFSSSAADSAETRGAPFSDPNPENETAGKLRVGAGCGPLDESGRRSQNATKRVWGREDRIRVTASRGRQEGQRGMPGNGRFGAGVLQLAASLCGIGIERAAGTASVAPGESEAE